MKLSNTRKASLALLGIAVASWCVDRAWFEGPVAAAAASEAPAVPVVAEAEASAAPVVAIASDGISDRLRAWSDSHSSSLAGLRDAFVPPQSWIAKPKAVAKAAPQQDGFQVVADEFRKTHALKAILLDSHGGRALVDEHLIAVGQRVGDFQLMSLTRTSALFSNNVQEIQLNLQSPTAGNVP